MEPEARYTLVGTSVLILLALATAAVVWLVATREGADVRGYKIYFAKQSLEGLEVRSDVKMKGIRVGSVTGFPFSSKRPGTVEVTVGIDPGAPVLQSTRAVVERNLITGLANIKLVNLDDASPKLTETAAGENDPVIAEGESQLQQLSATVNGLAERADETMRQLNAALSPENQAALTETLQNLRLLSRNAGGSLASMDKTLVSTSRAAESVRIAATAISGDVHRLAGRYDALGAEATDAIREASGSVGQLSASVARLSDRTEGLLVDGTTELRLAGEQLRTTAAALGTTARKLSEPRAILFGPAPASLGPGEARR